MQSHVLTENTTVSLKTSCSQPSKVTRRVELSFSLPPPPCSLPPPPSALATLLTNTEGLASDIHANHNSMCLMSLVCHQPATRPAAYAAAVMRQSSSAS